MTELVTANQSQLALRFKISRNTVIERLEEAGIHPIAKGGPGGTRYEITPELEDALQLKYVRSDRKTAAQERKLEAEAALKELEVKIKTGEFVRMSDVELAAVNLFRSLHLKLVQYADDTALDISRLKTRGDVAAYQKTGLSDILQDLRANPNNYITQNLDRD